MAGNPKCAAHRRDGAPCGRYAISGGTVCPSHGGAAPQARAAAARRLERARAEAAVITLGLPRDVSPTEALLEEVRWTAGHVEWLRGRVAELHPEPTHVATTLDGEDAGFETPSGRGSLVWGTTKVKVGGDDAGTTQEAKPSVWYELYTRERAHLVKVSEAAIRAGVEERRVRLAEQQGALVAGVITRVLDGMLAALTQAGLAAHLEQVWAAAVPVVVPRELRALGGAS